MTSPQRTGWIVAALMLACVGLIIRHGNSANAVHRHFNQGPRNAPTASVSAGQKKADQATSPVQIRDPQQVLEQGSLRDTVADGDVTVGFAGQLEPDRQLRRLFDYYLGLTGETSVTGIRGLLQQNVLQRRLSSPVADQVMTIFDDYVRYQQAAVDLAQRPDLDLSTQLVELRTLRRQMLGDQVAQAFYSAEETQQALLLQRLAVESNPDLSPAQKQHQLQTLDAALPAAEREARMQASVGHLVQQQTALFDDAHTDPATRHAERAQIWGETVATRLALLDQQRAQWQTRLDAYSAQRTRIEQNDKLDNAARQTALQHLLHSSFHGTERLQVQAMANGDEQVAAAR